MQEGQVTVGDETVVLPPTFWVLATQNPIEHEGTYPAPRGPARPVPDEAHGRLPRPRVRAGDARPAGRRRDGPASRTPRCAPPLFGPADVLALPGTRRGRSGSPRRSRSTSSTSSARPATRRATASTSAPLLELGASPRATIALVRAARGHALLRGRDYVTPHDVKILARDVLRHRIIDQLRGRRRGADRRRHPRPDPRPDSGALSRARWMPQPSAAATGACSDASTASA